MLLFPQSSVAAQIMRIVLIVRDFLSARLLIGSFLMIIRLYLCRDLVPQQENKIRLDILVGE
jgi:hypothetical protein